MSLTFRLVMDSPSEWEDTILIEGMDSPSEGVDIISSEGMDTIHGESRKMCFLD